MTTRRSFIKKVSLGAAAFSLTPFFGFKAQQEIGLQMYTMRNVIDQDVVGTISKISRIGYRKLEIGHYSIENKFWGFEPKVFKDILDSNDLSVPSGHFGFENLFATGSTDDLKVVLDAANEIGQRYLTVSYLPDVYRKKRDDYKTIAARLNIAGETCQEAGIQLTYHNHDFEFVEFEQGTSGYDILLKETDPQLMQFELDLFWAVKAGIDPVDLFKTQPGRFPMWHVKDLDPVTQSFTEVGTGTIDFKRIFNYGKEAGLKHFFVEQDEIKKDVFVSIGESFDYVSSGLLK